MACQQSARALLRSGMSLTQDCKCFIIETVLGAETYSNKLIAVHR